MSIKYTSNTLMMLTGKLFFIDKFLREETGNENKEDSKVRIKFVLCELMAHVYQDY